MKFISRTEIPCLNSLPDSPNGRHLMLPKQELWVTFSKTS